MISRSDSVTAVSRGTVVGVDASRNRSGGAKAHLQGLLTSFDPRDAGIAEVHLWSYPSLLQSIPDAPWLHKHAPTSLGRSLVHQLWWQSRDFDAELRRAGCDVLLSTSAGSVSSFSPAIVMSRDLLAFEPGEMQRFGLSPARLRLELLKRVQVRSLRRANGALFLTQYAAESVQHHTGPLPESRVIPHGVGETFRAAQHDRRWPTDGAAIQCVYVSNTEWYKHQWHVVDAFALLRARGYNVELTLVGGGQGTSAAHLERVVRRVHANDRFVTRVGAVPHEELPRVLERADLFVFASSCENLPNTLLEAMASGLPIACSDRGPMPEVLRDGGTYFDPENPSSIAAAVEELLRDAELRERAVASARRSASAFTWSRCARETWQFVRDVHDRHSSFVYRPHHADQP